MILKMKFHTCLWILMMATLSILSCKSNSNENEAIQYYDDGKILRKYTVIDGKKEGLMIDYYPDGSVQGERMFKNDIQVGKTTIYHKNGKVKEVQYYTDGKIQGGDTLFYETGQPEMVITLDRGIKHGYMRKWAPDGTLIYEAKFDQDKIVEVKGVPVATDSIK